MQKIDLNTLKSSVDLVELAGRHTELKLVSRATGEHHGPCPQCGGSDRFVVQSEKFMCRKCHERWGDAIEFVMWLDGVDFKAACERLAPGGVPMDVATHPARPRGPKPPPPPPKPVQPPAERWQNRAHKLIDRAETVLWSDAGKQCLDELHRRGFTDETIKTARLGCISRTVYDKATAWGVGGDKVKLPEGILIPWLDGNQVLQLRVRLPNGATDVDGNPQKYTSIRGSAGSRPMYGADALTSARPAVMVEGEFDALSIQQEAGDIITPVATGSAQAARAAKWEYRLAACPTVLVAFDSDEAGAGAAKHWLNKLPNAKRWTPTRHDVNDMLQAGDDIKVWVSSMVTSVVITKLPN